MDKLEALRTRPPIDPQLVRTYEAMDPIAGAKAMKELAQLHKEVAVSLLAGMQPKKAAHFLDQLAAHGRQTGRSAFRSGGHHQAKGKRMKSQAVEL